MFGRQKEKPNTQENDKPQTTEKPNTETQSSSENEKLFENNAQLLHSNVDLKAEKTPLAKLKEYSSTKEIAENIDKEIAETKSALGEYLRQMDGARSAAEKVQRLNDLVAQATGKKLPKENPNKIEIEGLEIILDAAPIHELEAIETVVRSRQQRLLDLQKIKESMASLDSLSETEGLKYLVLEKEGIPEQIMLRTS
jgi:hypothetical protein